MAVCDGIMDGASAEAVRVARCQLETLDTDYGTVLGADVVNGLKAKVVSEFCDDTVVSAKTKRKIVTGWFTDGLITQETAGTFMLRVAEMELAEMKKPLPVCS